MRERVFIGCYDEIVGVTPNKLPITIPPLSLAALQLLAQADGLFRPSNERIMEREKLVNPT